MVVTPEGTVGLMFSLLGMTAALVSLMSAVAAAVIAKDKGRSSIGWFLLGLPFWVLAVGMVAYLPSKGAGAPGGVRAGVLSRKVLIFLALGFGLVVLGITSGFGIASIALVIVIGAVWTAAAWPGRAILVLCDFAFLIQVLCVPTLGELLESSLWKL